MGEHCPVEGEELFLGLVGNMRSRVVIQEVDFVLFSFQGFSYAVELLVVHVSC